RHNRPSSGGEFQHSGACAQIAGAQDAQLVHRFPDRTWTMVRKKAQLTSSKPRAQAKPLRTSGDYVRASVPATGVPLIEVMGRAMTAYAQFPIRLLKCTSPAQL